MNVRGHKGQPELLPQPVQDIEQADRVQPATDAYDHGVTRRDHVMPQDRPPDRFQDTPLIFCFSNGLRGPPS